MARRFAFLGTCLLGVLLAGGIAYAGKSYADRRGDVTGGAGPDIVSVRVSNTAVAVRFSITFAEAPPLSVSTREKWVDMLLIGIDVPPFGPLPVMPGGEWPGANFALGTHGPSTSGMIVRSGRSRGKDPRVGTFPIARKGATLTFSVPRRLLDNPKRFTFSVAAARETESPTGGGIDLAPGRGTFRYDLT